MPVFMKPGSPFLFDQETGDIVGVKDSDGGEQFFPTSAEVAAQAAAIAAVEESVSALDPDFQPAISSVSGSETFYGKQSGTPKKFTLSAIGDWLIGAFSGFQQAGAGAVARTLRSRLRDWVSLKDFGAVGDGVTDDSDAVQAFVDYIVANHVHGWAPAGTYKLTRKINFHGTYGWGITGSGMQATIFKQFADNTPIFDLGSTTGPGMHSYLLSDMELDYNNSQPATNTDANPIRFSQMGYEGSIRRISFAKGSWAIKVVSGIGGPWGQDWDELNFGSGLTGGAMDWTGAINGVPNNKWGRFFVTASNMVGPIFKGIKGYNWTWDALELLDGKNAQWIDAQAGASLHLRAIKMELNTYSGAPVFSGDALMYFPSGNICIGQVHIGGTIASFLFSASRNLITVTNGSCSIENLVTLLTTAPTWFYLISCSGLHNEIKYLTKGTYPVPYTNVGSSASADYVTVIPDKNDKVSQNKGDADYTIASGDPAIIRYETTLTAVRTVNLPADNTCFNGLRYRVISYGAVNGANTILVKASGNTKATLSADKTFVDLEWRRNPISHAGWLIVGAGTLP